MGNAGRVLMIPKGDYNPATPYEMLDCVYYNGRSYVCKQASTGHAPTDIMYWQPMTPDSSAEIQALTNYVYDSGVKNLLENTFVTRIDSGVTFTHQSDDTVLANGTNSGGNILIEIGEFTGLTDVIISGCPSGGSATTYEVQLRDKTANQWVSGSDYGSGRTISSLDVTHTYSLYIIMRSGYVANNVLFKPMITTTTTPHSDYAHYQPYAKTNVELTQDVAGLTTKSFTKITNSEYANEILFAKSGTSKIVQVSAPKGIAANTNVEIAIPSGYTSEVAIPTGSLASFTSDFVISGGKIRMSINNAGNLKLRSSIAITSAIDEVLYMPYI